MNPEEKRLANPALARKVYSKPQLQVYGDLRALTHSGNPLGAMDSNPNHQNTH
jgi:hypothetical protein